MSELRAADSATAHPTWHHKRKIPLALLEGCPGDVIGAISRSSRARILADIAEAGYRPAGDDLAATVELHWTCTVAPADES